MSRSIRARVAKLEGERVVVPDTAMLWEVIGGGDPARLDAAGRLLLAEMCTRPTEPDPLEERMRAALQRARDTLAAADR
ncbi:hypothetical protein J0H58_29695 [bacterium]|nr:hypothetical protein [bacterium]